MSQTESGKAVAAEERTRSNRITYVFPDAFPQTLKRFKGESGLSWSETAHLTGQNQEPSRSGSF